MPDIMARAGCKLREVGTTNRTHLAGLRRGASGRGPALILKVHTSNYAMQGFTAAVAEAALGALAHEHKLPFIVDLGSGTLVDLRATACRTSRRRAKRSRTARDRHLQRRQAARRTAGRAHRRPQGSRRAHQEESAEARAARRQDDARGARGGAAALSRPRAPAARAADAAPAHAPAAEIEAQARAPAAAAFVAAFGERARVTVVDCASQIGSGSLPVDRLPSAALVRAGRQARRRLAAGASRERALRALPSR